ncbi:MAG TPA: HAD family hydrolase [Thermohalobaculum sp.]|nr:HAD family hydrolase [Thermohalobaculum sp.]
MNIAMWSGPRNLSTAMMYAFGARPDCAVWDEPFYAAYLKATGKAHPMAAEIMARHETDPARVARRCAAPAPDGSPLFYQKQMAHHVLPEFDLGWMAHATHVFLIRHPARVIASYAAKREEVAPGDIGAAEQHALYAKAEAAMGRPPPVIDSADIRAAPEAMLRALCAAIGIAFERRMLSWPAGGRVEDGAWAPHWYGAAHRSTGFAGPEGPLPEVPRDLRPVLDRAMEPYESLRARALAPETDHA